VADRRRRIDSVAEAVAISFCVVVWHRLTRVVSVGGGLYADPIIFARVVGAIRVIGGKARFLYLHTLFNLIGVILPGFYIEGYHRYLINLALLCAFIYLFITWVLSSLIIRFLDLFFEW
jgi:hypothetical protein